MLKSIKYHKMNGAGNEFIIIDNSEIGFAYTSNVVKSIYSSSPEINYDQLITIEKRAGQYLDINIWNKDGSTAEACGNASRCVAKLIFDEMDCEYVELRSKHCVHICKKMINGGVTVNMGQANTEWKSIPTLLEVNDTLNFNYNFDFKDLEGVKYTSVINVGNPHIIFWFDNIENIKPQTIGPLVESHKIFPEKINVSFAEIIDKNNIKLVVWERGAGITKACGTAACAAAYSAMKLGLSSDNLNISLPGGTLEINIDSEGNIHKTGPVELEYSSSIAIEGLYE
ncbi:MAG: diaminopimelate epimerase [Rhodobiaceae bacterium]|nr:diaminopimelate epimerase [Rhodobiaceae bacterium]|tara:strand:- start:6957 stop:7808 length:852 start_codon:yes stop_codon:yes gene_type:complete